MKLFLYTILLSITLVIATSCGQNTASTATTGDSIKMQHAQLLSIAECDGYKLVSIADPWRKGATLHQYALIEKGAEVPPTVPAEATVVRVPLEKLCVSTSVHTNLLMELGAASAIASVCDMNYIISPSIKREISTRHIADAGSSMNPSVEKIVQLGTDAILMSPFEGASYGLLEKTNIPIIECADYMETSALGRAEWMKFYGMLVGREAEANEKYNAIATQYAKLQREVQTNTSAQQPAPRLLVDMLNGQTWYMPGRQSTYGALYADAGANYSIGDSTLSGTQALSLERVMTTALDADVWIIKYGQAADLTYESLGQQNSAYTRFAPYQHRNIYGCNTMLVPFYDEAPFHPERILADMIKILHPNLLPDYKLLYYKPLQ